jgi:hypothetical protein
MSRENPKWRRLYLALRPTLQGESMPAGEAFTAVHGSTKWNYNTAHQWKYEMDRRLRRDWGLTSTTEVAYRLDPPDQSLPAGIRPGSVDGRIFEVLAAAAGEPVRPGPLIDAVWIDPDKVGSQGSLEVGICHLRAAMPHSTDIVSTGCILLAHYDRCEADFESRPLISSST